MEYYSEAIAGNLSIETVADRSDGCCTSDMSERYADSVQQNLNQNTPADHLLNGPQRRLVPPPPAPPFTATRPELFCALFSYIAAYCYIEFIRNSVDTYTNSMVWTARLCLPTVAVFIIFAAEYLNREKWVSQTASADRITTAAGVAATIPQERVSSSEQIVETPAEDLSAPINDASDRRESYIWLACFLLCIAGFFLHFAPNVLELRDPLHDYTMIQNWREGVWDQAQTLLFIHIFAVWWVLSRSGALADGRSGHLLPLDALNGFIVIPFGNLFLRIQTWLWSLHEVRRSKGSETRRPRVTWRIVLAAAACLMLFVTALRLLSSADSNFDRLFEDLREFLHFEPDLDIVFRILFSIPVGAWLYGLLGGSVRLTREKTETQKASVMRFLASLRGVPTKLWIAVVSLFSLAYAVFYVLQASYLFGAFTGTLPEGFIVSQYAREGFFELCRVMAVNFALLWIVTRMTREADAAGRTLKILCLILLAESALFAVIALSKLSLYISVFGFTPLRLQSSWLVCTLLAGCALWAWSLLTGRPAFRKWMIFGALSLSLLCLY